MPSGHAASWYPSHIKRARDAIKNVLNRHIDLYCEVRDARLPLSSYDHNLAPRAIMKSKARMIVVNRSDLGDRYRYREMKDLFSRYHGPAMFACMGGKEVSREAGKTLLHAVTRLSEDLFQYNPVRYETVNICVIGYPNVGKSSLINKLIAASQLTKKRGLKTEMSPGTTRSISEKVLIHQGRPRIYIWDTPGLLWPTLNSAETARSLALCHLVPEHRLKGGLLEVAQHAKVLVERLRPGFLERKFGYRQSYSVGMDDFIALLRRQWFDGRPLREHSLAEDVTDHDVLTRFISDFREGRMGQFCLEDIDETRFRKMFG